GFDTPKSGELNYQSNRFIFDVDVFRNIGKELFLGLGVNYKQYGNIDYLNDTTVIYPELKNENNIGIKVICLKDARNNILSPSEGDYFEFSNAFNFGSSFYSKISIDYRHYLGLGNSKKHTLAGRFYQTSVFGSPPFYDYSVIGGDKYARGYYLGRFRDNHFSTLQLEMRNHLFWRIGISTFGGISMIYEKVNSIEKESFKPNAGIGLRFLVDEIEGTNLRFDYAVGANNQSGFYISFGESF
ncbi:MAG: outer membrane protein assembly factor, partial [Bacteroidales bacterium]|nr:outer membrane protein assembly factor [Bacteroidales bacterium]